MKSMARALLIVIGTLILAGAATGPDDAISNLSGWADKIVGFSPRWLANPKADFWGILVGAILVAVSMGIWIWPLVVRSIDAHKWWQGKARFTISEAACVLCGISPSNFAKSERAKALANDILGGVRNGMIRVDGESWVAGNIGLAIGSTPSRYPKKPEATFDTLIEKNALEGFAKHRGFKLPWPLPAKD